MVNVGSIVRLPYPHGTADTVAVLAVLGGKEVGGILIGYLPSSLDN